MSVNFQAAMSTAKILRDKGQFLVAAQHYHLASRLTTTDPLPLFFRAAAFKDAGDKDAALQAYKDLVAQYPGYALGWSFFGIFLKDLKRFDEAVVVLRRSLEIEENVETRNLLVISLYNDGRFDESKLEGFRNLLRKDKCAMEKFPNSPWSGVVLGEPREPFSRRSTKMNVISFSLWGDIPAYVHGAIVNARIAPHMYQGWVTRFYVDDSVPADAVVELRRAGAQIVEMKDPALQAVKPMWRFFASDDPDVNYFISRDTDSRLNPQELLGVEEWVRSPAKFHVMRDHIYHMELILAGMWGGAAGVLPNIKSRLMADRKYHDNKFADQAFLADDVWPLIKNSLITHDSLYRFHNGREFPVAYRLSRPVHVGGSVKEMPPWR